MKEQEIDRIAAAIYEAPLGEYLGRDGAGILAAHAANERRLKDKEFLGRKGETTSSFYIVTEGLWRWSEKESTSARRSSCMYWKRGTWWASWALSTKPPSLCRSAPLGDAAVLCFNADDIKPLITEHPELIYNFMRTVIKRVHHLVDTLGEHELEMRQ